MQYYLLFRCCWLLLKKILLQGKDIFLMRTMILKWENARWNGSDEVVEDTL